MKPRLLCLAVLLGTLLAWPTRVAFAQLLSPGPLAAPHANLDSDEKCASCHAAGKGVANGLCLSCHGNVSKSGMHSGPWSGQACAKCHSDHRGRGFALIRFDPKSFAHGQVWTLNGAHASAKCAACHKGRSYIGLGTGCTSCHKDEHGGRFGTACLNCHNENAWGQVRIEKFDHSLARFQLRGAHASVACQNCHGSPPRWRGLDYGGCASCHNDPHKGRFGKQCTNCHVESTFHEIHMKVHPGLSLGNGHARVACQRCHDRGESAAPSRGTRCVSCHKAVHKAPFGKKCESCHSSIKWLGLPTKVGLRAHEKTQFALHGKHTSAPCQGCHKPSEPADKRFRNLVFDKCGACHSDQHKSEFSRRAGGGECGPCHTDEGFSPTLFGVDAHATTDFALVGHHVAVPCDKCHSNHKPAEQRLDWSVAERRCEKCHENPHGNQFDAEMKKRGCAGCHSAIGWDVPNIDHRIWPLTGAHASAPCARCHTPTEADRKKGRGPSYKNTPRDCEGCHKDVHQGQFRLTKPVKSCGFCHSRTRFAIRAFDHAKLAGYGLEGAHRRLSCDRCHSQEKLRDGSATTRWRLGYQRCRDCHADPHSEGG